MTQPDRATCEQVLQLVAAWLGSKKGWTDDGSPTPTGRDAYMHARGPMLVMDWQSTFSSYPACPTLLLEGGPFDWAVDASFDDELLADCAKLGVYLEPWNGHALAIASKS